MESQCISLIDKLEFAKTVDTQIENRTEFMKSLPLDSKSREGTEKLLENLRKTKQLIEDTRVCEIDG